MASCRHLFLISFIHPACCRFKLGSSSILLVTTCSTISAFGDQPRPPRRQRAAWRLQRSRNVALARFRAPGWVTLMWERGSVALQCLLCLCVFIRYLPLHQCWDAYQACSERRENHPLHDHASMLAVILAVRHDFQRW